MQARVAGPYVDGTKDDPPRERRLGVLRRLIPLVKPHRARLIFAIFCLFAASATMLVYPWAARYAVDVGMGSATPDDLDFLVIGVIIVFALNAVFVWLRHYTLSWLGERVVVDLRALVFDRIMTLPLGWFHERRSGELVGRLASDVTIVSGVVSSDLSMALRNGA